MCGSQGAHFEFEQRGIPDLAKEGECYVVQREKHGLPGKAET
jgi:hypothetical protein